MSDLDKFKGGLVPAASKTPGTPANVQPVALPWDNAPPPKSETADAILNSRRGQFAMALDATASMTPLISMAKEAIKQIMGRVIAEAKVPVRVQLFVYRDYDVPAIIVEHSPLSGEANELAGWLNGIRADGGGANNGEAIEQGLLAIERAGAFDAILLAGDEPYNSRAHLDKLGKSSVPTAADLARRSGQVKRPIHTFLVGSYADARRALQEIATASGGCFGQLDGSEAMIDMAVLAMLASLKGTAFIKDYMGRTALSHSGKEFATLLLKGPSS
jgi:hypothetical protein